MPPQERGRPARTSPGRVEPRRGKRIYPRRAKRKRQKHIHEGPRRTAKGHEGVGGGSIGICQGSGRGERIDTKGEKEKAKTYPRRATKNSEGPRRGWRGIDRDPPRVGKGGEDRYEGRKGKGKNISTKGHEERRRATKGLEETREVKAAAEAIPVSDLLATRQDIADLRAATKQDIARPDNRCTRLELAAYGVGATDLALLIDLAFFS